MQQCDNGSRPASKAGALKGLGVQVPLAAPTAQPGLPGRVYLGEYTVSGSGADCKSAGSHLSGFDSLLPDHMCL